MAKILCIEDEVTLRSDIAEELVDGAAVSDNGVSIHVLLALGRLTGDAAYTRRAHDTAAWATAQLEDTPGAMPYALRAWPLLMDEKADQEYPVTD